MSSNINMIALNNVFFQRRICYAGKSKCGSCDKALIFNLRAVKLDPSREDAGELLRNCCLPGKADILKMLLNRGYDPGKMEDTGTTMINSLASGMTWGFNPWNYERKKKDIDTSDARDRMKIVRPDRGAASKQLVSDHLRGLVFRQGFH